MYHGSDSYTGDVFNFNRPMWLISDKDEAMEYGNSVYEVVVTLNNPYMSSHHEKRRLGDSKLIDKAKRLGHDGIVMPPDNDMYELYIYDEAKYLVIIAFSADTIKSINPIEATLVESYRLFSTFLESIKSFDPSLIQTIIEAHNTITSDEVQEQFNRDFWTNPSTLYHGTSAENIEGIRRSGLVANENGSRKVFGGNKSRKNQKIIFTVKEDELSTIKSLYGGSIVAINTDKMKQDGFTPRVSMEDEIADVYASGEEEVDFGDLRDINSFESTVIIETDVIPTKYLTLPPKQKAVKKTTWTSSELADLLSPWSTFGISPKETNEIINRNAILLEDPAFYLEFKSIKPEYKTNPIIVQRVTLGLVDNIDMKRTANAFNEEKWRKLLGEYYGIPTEMLDTAIKWSDNV